MGISVLLMLISLSIAILFLGVFYWSIKSGQYDDTYTPSVRILFEDKKNEGNKKGFVKKIANSSLLGYERILNRKMDSSG